MFESLADRLQGIFRTLSGQGRLTPDNIRDSLRHAHGHVGFEQRPADVAE